MNRFSIFVVIIFICTGMQIAFPHEHLKQAKKDSTSNKLRELTSQPEEQFEKPYKLNFSEAVKEHLHNKIVHIPIGFALAAFVLSVFGIKRKEFQNSVRWLVFIAALGGIAAYFTGNAQADAFEGTAKDWVVELHENLGIATIALLMVWTLSEFVRPLRKYAFILGVITFVLILVTGFFGGILAHG